MLEPQGLNLAIAAAQALIIWENSEKTFLVLCKSGESNEVSFPNVISSLAFPPSVYGYWKETAAK